VAGVQAWRLGDDEVLLLAPASTRPDKAAGMGQLAGRLRAGGAAVTDLGSGLGVLRLIGPATPRGLERACPVDLSTRAVPDRRIVQAPVAGVRVILARQDHPDALGYTLLAPRDLVEYLWDALLELGSDIGLVPVGGDVARPGFVGTARTTS
jgi:aminomethyltransferase